MTYATRVWSIGQGLLACVVRFFTQLGYHRFGEWITAMAIGRPERQPGYGESSQGAMNRNGRSRSDLRSAWSSLPCITTDLL